jgi:hypothetical protein
MKKNVSFVGNGKVSVSVTEILSSKAFRQQVLAIQKIKALSELREVVRVAVGKA